MRAARADTRISAGWRRITTNFIGVEVSEWRWSSARTSTLIAMFPRFPQCSIAARWERLASSTGPGSRIRRPGLMSHSTSWLCSAAHWSDHRFSMTTMPPASRQFIIIVVPDRMYPVTMWRVIGSGRRRGTGRGPTGALTGF